MVVLCPSPTALCAALFVCASIASVPAQDAASSAAPIPAGLDAADWLAIRTLRESARHAATEVDGGYRAPNPNQRWSTFFDRRGFTVQPDDGGWSWGLELASYGADGNHNLVVAPLGVTADGGRVEYAWDATLTEWYVNDARGLEHGYTLHRRPSSSGDGPVTLELAVRGGLAARIADGGRDVDFAIQDGGVVVAYRGLCVFDADGRELDARFDAATPGTMSLTIDDAGARYPVTIDPIVQRAYLKASNPDSDDAFGAAVAVSGDTVVVGAPNEDGVAGNQGNVLDATNFGAAYVFVRSGTTWSQQAYLKPNDAPSPPASVVTVDNFGFSVAISGDTIVVGTPLEDGSTTGVNGVHDENAPGSGAAYVFVRSGTTWTQQAYLKASNTGGGGPLFGSGDEFGRSVAIAQDTVVVGAPNEGSSATGVNGNQGSEGAPQSGAAYVFVRSGTTWSQQAYLKASNTDAGDAFGGSVSASGDTVVVGAGLEDSGATGVNGSQTNTVGDTGAAYVFARSGTTWSQQAYLKASNTGAGDGFGGSVSVSGATIVVGARDEDSSAIGVGGNQNNESAANSGAAYVFTRTGTIWTQQAYLKASNTGASDRFGTSVSVSGDVAIVGAPEEDSDAIGVHGSQTSELASRAGAAYVFERSGTTWSQLSYVKASNTDANDFFGGAVAVAGTTAVVGARLEDSNATGVNGPGGDNSVSSAGAAYAYDLAGPVGAFTQLAPGCINSTGAAAVLTKQGGGVPQVTTTMTLQVTNAPPSTQVAAILFGCLRLAPPSGVDLGLIGGQNGCAVHVQSVATLPIVIDGSGAGALPIALPLQSLGLTFFFEAAMVDPASPASLKVVVSSTVEGLVGA